MPRWLHWHVWPRLWDDEWVGVCASLWPLQDSGLCGGSESVGSLSSIIEHEGTGGQSAPSDCEAYVLSKIPDAHCGEETMSEFDHPVLSIVQCIMDDRLTE